MELIRAFLIGAVCLLGFMLWQAWENDYASKVTLTQPTNAVTNASSSTATQSTSTQTISAPTATAAHGQLIQVHTDVLDVVIDTVGGNIVEAKLLNYPQKSDGSQKEPFELLNTRPATFYVAQSGLLGEGGPDTLKGQAIYSTKKTNYQLNQDQKELTVDLTWQSKNGIVVHKQFIFTRDDYAIKVNYQIDNRSNKPWIGQLYSQLQLKKPPAPEHSLFGINPSYIGGAISSSQKPYEKISFDKMAENNLNIAIQGGWLAMQQHYFLSAWIPNKTETFNYYSHKDNGDLYTLGMLGPLTAVQPGAQTMFSAKLYTGPEIMDRLAAVAPNLNLTIDYGILWFISIAIFWLLKHIYQFIGNWGWSIVLVTFFIKLLFYQLSAKSYRSMAAMRKLQPKLTFLKERYGEDRQKLTQETMALYKKEKINPLGGCLPIIVQIPVFIALYWVLLESVELRQAPFILWIKDLSTKDPYYVLPVLMGITMFVQQKLNPPPPDPMQAKMMQFLPIFFTFLFISFPAGLVLYWVVNNSLSILQQWYVMRSCEAQTAKEIEDKRKKKK